MDLAQRTPSKTGQQIDRHIDYLNAKWDLRLPRLHGIEAQDAENSDEHARKCSARIRALCWNGRVNVDSIIADFEEQAAYIRSEWIYKPQQDRGTLLSLPRSKSFLRRDPVARAIGPQSEERRQQLVKTLAGFLHDEYQLSRESDVYSRNSLPPGISTELDNSEIHFDPSTSFTTAQPAQEVSSDAATNTKSSAIPHSAAGSVRRRSTSTESSMKLKKRRKTDQSSIRRYLQAHDANQEQYMSDPKRTVSPISARGSISTPFVSSGEPVASFATNLSEEPPPLFSPQDSTTSSARTSILSFNEDPERPDDTQYTDSTQFARDALEDPNIMRSLSEVEYTRLSSSQLLDRLDELNPFNQTGSGIPPGFPAWATWELHRYASAIGLPPAGLYNSMRGLFDRSVPPSYDEFYSRFETIGEKHGIHVLPQKSKLPNWLGTSTTYCDPQMRQSLYFSAKVDFQQPFKDSVLNLTLLPMKVDMSCRCHRRWGADRFLEIDLPYFTNNYLPQGLKTLNEDDHVQARMVQLFGKEELRIAGRVWRAFFLEKYESRTRKKEADTQSQRLHLFAVDGYDMTHRTQSQTPGSSEHTPVDLRDLIQWHIPLAANSVSTDLKLYSRWKLCLSKTIPTVVLKPIECIPVADMKPIDANGREDPTGPEMNDGCGRISKELANAVWVEYCGSKTSDDVPSCFQARFGGCKGLWFVDHSNAHPGTSDRNFWIEVSPAQCKIKPNPHVRKDSDDSQLTFEVVKHSKRCQPAHLNIQFSNILNDRGVPQTVFEQLLRDDLKDYVKELRLAMRDPDTRALRAWMQTYQDTPSQMTSFSSSDDQFGFRDDEVNMLLEHGFRADDCPRMVQGIKSFLKRNLDRYTDKMRLSVPRSTTVFCIADPYRVLEEGQVQINFSRPFKNPKTGGDEIDLEGKRVLLARNPGALPSDIQTAEAVFHKSLRQLRDCIVFSTKGKVPLASKLSGGDYDGDTVMVIWDQDIVNKFQNVDVPKLPSGVECGLQSKNRPVNTCMNPDAPTAAAVDEFLASCMMFNSNPAKVGLLTILHEQLVYSCRGSMASAIGIKLAALNGYLVDATKQGWYLPDSALKALNAEARSLGRLREVAYKSEDPRPQRGLDSKCVNHIDSLKFDVAYKIRDSVLSDFEKAWMQEELKGQLTSKQLNGDQELRAPYADACDKADATDRAILDQLRTELVDLRGEWGRRFPMKNTDLFGEKHGKKDINLAGNVEELTRRFLSIQPCPQNQPSQLCLDYEREGNSENSKWSRIRASCLYSICGYGSAPWHLAGGTLRKIKVCAQGEPYMMLPKFRSFFKFDSRGFKRCAEAHDNNDSEVESDDGFDD